MNPSNPMLPITVHFRPSQDSTRVCVPNDVLARHMNLVGWVGDAGIKSADTTAPVAPEPTDAAPNSASRFICDAALIKGDTGTGERF